MLSNGSLARVCLGVGTLSVLAGASNADTVTVTLAGSHIESVTSGGVTVDIDHLTPGQSSGEAAFLDLDGFGITAADGRNLDFYFARSGSAPNWFIDLGLWRDTNGSDADFFVFEIGGNDSIQVAPRLPNGAYGQDVSVTGWTNTGYTVPMGPNSGQRAYGLAFDITDLRDTAGASLAQNALITGIRIRSASVDGASFLAVDPNPDPLAGLDGDGSVAIVGELRTWHPIEAVFQGPWARETDTAPNPFLDYRLEVVFQSPGVQAFRVPGFFDADGDGGDRGRIWKARFSPDRPGTWTVTAHFRRGTNVAVGTLGTGTPGLLDGVSTQFTVLPRDPQAPGFLSSGRLRHDGGHYRSFADGPHFLKGGTNSPENLLAYRGFHEVSDAGGAGILHKYGPHVSDWMPHDPNFRSNVYPADGRGIIGALNYLSSVGVNSVYAILMNLGGDGQDVHPFLGPADTGFNRTHYDTSRLHQWNIVFEHAARKGIALHLAFGETESANENWLDGGNLGPERKLFYREMIARFAHNAAIKWNLCEENDFSVTKLEDFASYIAGLDPYDHIIAFHNHTNDFSDYNQVTGDPRFSATSLQYTAGSAGSQVETLRAQSAAAGHPWVVETDENAPASTGLTDSNTNNLRKSILYDVLFSGGNIEWYLGWHDLPLGGDVTLEDFRTREEMWKATTIARRFLEDNLPYWTMQPMDQLLANETGSYGGGEVFAEPGTAYAVYLPASSPNATLDLSGATGAFSFRWFNPRTGLFEGGDQTIQGGGSLALGSPPSDTSNDWVALIEKTDLTVNAPTISASAGGTVGFFLEPGLQYAGRTFFLVGSSSGTTPGLALGGFTLPLNFDDYMRITIEQANGAIFVNTNGSMTAGGWATSRIIAPPGALAPFVGMTLHHAYALIQPLDYVSQPVEFRVVP